MVSWHSLLSIWLTYKHTHTYANRHEYNKRTTQYYLLKAYGDDDEPTATAQYWEVYTSAFCS